MNRKLKRNKYLSKTKTTEEKNVLLVKRPGWRQREMRKLKEIKRIIITKEAIGSLK